MLFFKVSRLTNLTFKNKIHLKNKIIILNPFKYPAVLEAFYRAAGAPPAVNKLFVVKHAGRLYQLFFNTHTNYFVNTTTRDKIKLLDVADKIKTIPTLQYNSCLTDQLESQKYVSGVIDLSQFKYKEGILKSYHENCSFNDINNHAGFLMRLHVLYYLMPQPYFLIQSNFNIITNLQNSVTADQLIRAHFKFNQNKAFNSTTLEKEVFDIKPKFTDTEISQNLEILNTLQKLPNKNILSYLKTDTPAEILDRLVGLDSAYREFSESSNDLTRF
jgi:hypothetical protein